MSEPANHARADLLLAEDDPDDRFMMLRALKRVRPLLQVVAVQDGIELMAYLHGCAADALPQLVLLDLNMPRMDGREVLSAMRAEAALCRIPVVVLTTSVEPEDRDQAMALKAAAFASKPDEYAQLVRMLEELLARQLDRREPAET
jgi:CheY-like chemotaxis protein